MSLWEAFRGRGANDGSPRRGLLVKLMEEDGALHVAAQPAPHQPPVPGPPPIESGRHIVERQVRHLARRREVHVELDWFDDPRTRATSLRIALHGRPPVLHRFALSELAKMASDEATRERAHHRMQLAFEKALRG